MITTCVDSGVLLTLFGFFWLGTILFVSWALHSVMQRDIDARDAEIARLNKVLRGGL